MATNTCGSFTVPPGILSAPVSHADMAGRGRMPAPITSAPEPTMPFITNRRLTFAMPPGWIAVVSNMWVMTYTPVEARRTASAMR